MMRRTRRIKSHLSTLISSISLPAEHADNVKRCCRTRAFRAAKTSEGAVSQRQDGCFFFFFGGGRKMEKLKKAQIGRRVSPGKGELERTCACMCVRPCVPPPSAEEMDLCHLGPLMAVYISIYMRTSEGRGDGARTRSPGQICPGWLTSPPPPIFLPPSSPQPGCFYSTQ